MAECFRCKQEMCDESTITCKEYNIVNFPDGTKMSPVPYTPNDPKARCHDCNVAAGGSHHVGCDMEICPRCGGEFLECSCFVSEGKTSNTKTNHEVSESTNLFADLDELMKKHKINTFWFFGQEDDESAEYYVRYELSNYIMMKIVSTILFMDNNFEATRDVIISDILKYIDPGRVVCSKNDKGEWEEIPFIPSAILED